MKRNENEKKNIVQLQQQRQSWKKNLYTKKFHGSMSFSLSLSRARRRAYVSNILKQNNTRASKSSLKTRVDEQRVSTRSRLLSSFHKPHSSGLKQ